MRCPKCDFEQPEGGVECATCGVVFAKYKGDKTSDKAGTHKPSEPAGSPPQAEPGMTDAQIRAALAADDPQAEGRSALRAGIETLLFVVSFPVIIPSLIIAWLGAKKWGRVDLLVLGFPILLVFAAGTWFPNWLVPMGVALVATLVLWVLRLDKRQEGIFLGYSNMVILPLITGGLVFGAGQCAAPDDPTAGFEALSATEVTVDEIRFGRAVPGNSIIVSNGKLDSEHRFERADTGERWVEVVGTRASVYAGNGHTVWYGMLADEKAPEARDIQGLYVDDLAAEKWLGKQLGEGDKKPPAPETIHVIRSPEAAEAAIEAAGDVEEPIPDPVSLGLRGLGILLLGFSGWRAFGESAAG